MSAPSTTMTPAQIIEARRRKVRKGTHSCWECRRRKIRCQYSSPDDTVCIGCQSRGSSCRSQEFADVSSLPQQVPEKKVAQRLDRLETMMEQLMAHVLTTTPAGAGRDGGSGGSSASPSAANQAARASHKTSSVATSDDGDTSFGQYGVDNGGLIDDDDLSLERAKKMFRDPAEVVARMCPTAAAKQGYGVLDVLDTSTADDTPVAALLGIQDSLSHGNTTTSNANAHAAGPGSTQSGAPAHSASSLSPESADASVDSPSNGGGTGTVTSTSTSGTSIGTGSVSEAAGTRVADTFMAAVTAAGLSDPVTEVWARHSSLSKLLHSLFPAQEDINTATAGAAAQQVLTIFHSQHDVDMGRCEAVSKLREIPPVTSHPTVIGRRLLQITLCMQQMAPCFVLQNKLNLPAGSLSDVINRIVGVVCHTITSNDELIGSVEGLECLVLLGMQQSNAGQLRKAWLTFRRAMSLAQLMGLDRGNTRALKSCDPTSDPRTRPTPEAMWYRINACDRYVSLLLGLRAGSQDDEAFLEKEGTETEVNGSGGGALALRGANTNTDTPVERLEKVHTLLTGRIIERNHSKMSLEQSYAVTEAIDRDLKVAASRNIGPSWWEVPTYDPYARPEFTFKELSRCITQVHHHCILILLHLPYMLRGDNPSPAAEGRHAQQSPSKAAGCTSGLAYSKATCMQSSRAVLQRFMRFRLVNKTAFSCRHVDYATLIAAMTLIIGYLGPRPAATSDPAVLDNFDNQLRADRAMVEQVRERMEHIGKANADRLSRESAATIQQLLPVLDLVSRKLDETGGAGATATTATTATTAMAGTGTGMKTESAYGLPGSSVSTAAPSATPVSVPYQSPGSVPNGGGGLGGTVAGVQGGSNNAYNHDGGPATTPTLSSVRLNVPYFGTVNIHANNASPAATGHYQQPYHQQQQQQQQQHQHQHQHQHQPQQSLPAGFSPMSMPVSYGMFSSSPAPAGMNWTSSLASPQGQCPGQSQSQSQSQGQGQSQSQSHVTGSAHSTPPNPPQHHHHHHDAVDLNAMLVDFDPIPIHGDDGGGDGGLGGGAGDGSDGYFGFGGPSAFPDLTGSTDDWVMQGVDTTYWSLLNGGGGSFGGQIA